METIRLNRKIVVPYEGKGVDVVPRLLKFDEEGKGRIFSEVDLRFFGVEKLVLPLLNNCWDTSTQSWTRKEIVKVVQPYRRGEKNLTEAAKFGLSLIRKPKKGSYNDDCLEDSWGRCEKWGEDDGVYTFRRDELDVGRELSEEDAKKNSLLLTRLCHPDYVKPEFWRFEDKEKSRDSVEALIRRSYELGKKDYMMKQYLPDVEEKARLRLWCVGGVDGGFVSVARSRLDGESMRFAFDKVPSREGFEI